MRTDFAIILVRKRKTMDIKNAPISFFSLIFHSLKVANQAFGSILSLFIIFVVLIALVIGAVVGSLFLWGPRYLFILYIPASIFLGFLNFVFMTAIIQILAAKIERRGFSAWEGLTGSIVPSFYFILSSIILGIPVYLLLFAAMLTHSTIVYVLCIVALFFVTLPFTFTLHAAALRDEGPISALRYSWELGSRNYLRILLTVLGLILLMLLFFLALGCAIKAFWPELLVQLPFYLAMPVLLFQSKITFFVALILFYLICLYFFSVIQCIWTGLFLNLDYMSRSSLNRELENAMANAPVVPEPIQPSDAVMPDVMIKQASIRTDADADPDTARHLDQVYSAQEHLPQSLEQEEDRMPTILFDEEMAKQLAENEERMRLSKEQAAKRKEDDQQQSIKISDKPL